MELLNQLNQERGITVLVVTHDDHVATYARRIVVIKDGLIESDVSHSQGGA
jgi:putative ABC transport system ATP-binding protein